jgi:hypothetical protein
MFTFVFIESSTDIVVGLSDFLASLFCILHSSTTIQLPILHCPYSNTNSEMSAGYSKMRRNLTNTKEEHYETQSKAMKINYI